MNIKTKKIGEKAQQITALQRGYTSWGDESKIADILCGTRGEALTALKLQIDQGKDQYDLVELLYHDIDDLELRSKIITHFRTQSQTNGGGINVRRQDGTVKGINAIHPCVVSVLRLQFSQPTHVPVLPRVVQRLPELLEVTIVNVLA